MTKRGDLKCKGNASDCPGLEASGGEAENQQNAHQLPRNKTLKQHNNRQSRTKDSKKPPWLPFGTLSHFEPSASLSLN